jgi:hypothetical protein
MSRIGPQSSNGQRVEVAPLPIPNYRFLDRQESHEARSGCNRSTKGQTSSCVWAILPRYEEDWNGFSLHSVKKENFRPQQVQLLNN